MSASILSLDDDGLIVLIRAARNKILFIAPGVSMPVARELSARWCEMGAKAAEILLDADPEICRLGYGTLEGLRLLQETSAKLHAKIQHRPGIRIGMLICDNRAIVFSPTPLLIEGGSAQFPHPNAIQFSEDAVHNADPTREAPAALACEAQDLIQGGEEITRQRVESVTKELSANPPLKFDLAQKVRVFNARFEFVEFELKGLAISRKIVSISSDLMGLADSKAQKLLRSTFKLVGEGSEVSGERVLKVKEWIVKRYLIMLPGYGAVILRSNKAAFETAVTALRRYVERFQKRIQKKLAREMDANREALLKALTPAVVAKHPARWTSQLGPEPSKEEITNELAAELKEAFGAVTDIFKAMKVNVVYKGVTYELLNDPKFIET